MITYERIEASCISVRACTSKVVLEVSLTYSAKYNRLYHILHFRNAHFSKKYNKTLLLAISFELQQDSIKLRVVT